MRFMSKAHLLDFMQHYRPRLDISTCTVCKQEKINDEFSYNPLVCADCNLKSQYPQGLSTQKIPTLANPFNGPDGENRGLGEWVRSPSHHAELLKKKKIVPVG